MSLRIFLGLFCFIVSSTVSAEFNAFGNNDTNQPRVGSIDWQMEQQRQGEQSRFQQQQIYQQQQQLDLQRQQLEEQQRQRNLFDDKSYR